MPDHDTSLERQLRAWADDLSDQAAAPAPVAVLDATSPPRRRRRGRYLAAAAAVVAVVATGVALGTRSDRPQRVTSDGGSPETLTVEYERSEYRQTADFRCQPTTSGRFDERTIETWGDRAGRRWRTRVTYPEDSTRDTIFTGSPWYPDDRYLRGEVLGAKRGCSDGRVGVQLFDSEDVSSLNPMAEEPEGLILHYDDLGSIVPGDHHDSTGRPATLYRHSTGGTSTSGSLPPADIEQVSDWYVDADGVLLESTYTSDVEGLSHTERMTTLVERGSRDVPLDWFSTEGYEQHDGWAQPDPCSDCLPRATTTSAQVEPAPDAYCDAVEAFRQSGTTAPDGLFTPEAAPFLEAIVAASPPEIVEAQRALADSARTGTPPPDDAPTDTTQYWATHC